MPTQDDWLASARLNGVKSLMLITSTRSRDGWATCFPDVRPTSEGRLPSTRVKSTQAVWVDRLPQKSSRRVQSNWQFARMYDMRTRGTTNCCHAESPEARLAIS